MLGNQEQRPVKEVPLGVKRAKSAGIRRFGNERLNNGIQQRFDNCKSHSGLSRSGCTGHNAMGLYDFRDRHNYRRSPKSPADRDLRLGTTVQALKKCIRLAARCRQVCFGERLEVSRRFLCELRSEEVLEEQIHLPPSTSWPLARLVTMGTTGVRSAPPRPCLFSRWGWRYSRTKYATTLMMRKPTITETESAATSAETT